MHSIQCGAPSASITRKEMFLGERDVGTDPERMEAHKEEGRPVAFPGISEREAYIKFLASYFADF